MNEDLKALRKIVQQRNPHRPIKDFKLLEADQYKSKYVCYFKNGDYATFWKWRGEGLSSQMNKGRWFNRKTKAVFEINF